MTPELFGEKSWVKLRQVVCQVTVCALFWHRKGGTRSVSTSGLPTSFCKWLKTHLFRVHREWTQSSPQPLLLPHSAKNTSLTHLLYVLALKNSSLSLSHSVLSEEKNKEIAFRKNKKQHGALTNISLYINKRIFYIIIKPSPSFATGCKLMCSDKWMTLFE